MIALDVSFDTKASPVMLQLLTIHNNVVPHTRPSTGRVLSTKAKNTHVGGPAMAALMLSRLRPRQLGMSATMRVGRLL